MPKTPQPAQSTDLPAPRQGSADAGTYAKLLGDWNAADPALAKGLVDVWTSVLGWGAGPAPGTTAPGGGSVVSMLEPLVGSKLDMVLSEFEEWCASCPLEVDVGA